MRYSLLSRFKATLLGMAVAEAYAIKHLPQSVQTINSLSCLTLKSARQLINNSHLNSDKSANRAPETNFNRAVAIAVPVALVTHESKAKLVQQLHLTPAAGTHWEAMLAIGYIIHQSIADRWSSEQFIPNLCYLMPENCLEFLQSLEIVQSWLEESSGLERVRRHQNGKHLIFPIYSFLSTPEDYVLTVQRALHLSDDSPYPCALAGALSGAYNGLSGIPPRWRLYLDPQIEAEIERLSVQLLASWSGVYQPRDRAKIEIGETLAGSSYTTIAAPQVMSSPRFPR